MTSGKSKRRQQKCSGDTPKLPKTQGGLALWVDKEQRRIQFLPLVAENTGHFPLMVQGILGNRGESLSK